jgi:hypothetical protein
MLNLHSADYISSKIETRTVRVVLSASIVSMHITLCMESYTLRHSPVYARIAS